MTRLLRFGIFLLCLAGCVGVKTGDVELLKPTLESFHRLIRWRDFRGASSLVAPERQSAFMKGRNKLNDERDLFITNYELEEATIAADGMTATAISKVSWYRLPSATEKTVVVTSVLAWRDGRWVMESQDDGPFEELLPAQKKSPVDSGPAEATGAGDSPMESPHRGQ